jgi:hypothetical protein
LALVQQLRFEHPPARIEHGLGHPRLSELKSAHIAYDDGLITINNGPRELMERVAPASRRPAMKAFGLSLVATALGRSQLLGVCVRPSTRFEPLPVAGRGDALQAEVDSD